MTGSSLVAASAAGALAALVVSRRFAPSGRRRTDAVGRARWPERHAPGDDTDRLIVLLDAVARDVRSGASLTAAVESALASPARPRSLDPAHDALRRGAAVSDALRSCEASSVGDPDLSAVAQVLTTCADVGGPSAEPIDRTATVLRERAAARADRRAHAAQALLSARVLTVVPIAFASWSASRDGRLREVYAHSRPAQLGVAGGLVLCVAGWHWMRRLVEGPR